jgi:hypothetical protein
MSNTDWLACNDPRRMLALFRGVLSNRKFWLLAIAGYRRWWLLLDSWLAPSKLHDRSYLEKGIEVLEDFIEIGKEFTRKGPVNPVYWSLVEGLIAEQDFEAAARMRDIFDFRMHSSGAAIVAERILLRAELSDDISPIADITTLVREVAGNPFAPAPLDRTWLTAVVLALSHAAYQERRLPTGELDGDRLAVLADALEDAGCTDGPILEHLRGPGPHVRGCWCLDLLLEKE